MNSYLSTLALTLIGAGSLIALVCSILLRVRAFKESLLWGLTSVFLPLGMLLFVVRFWEEKKKLFFTQLFGFALSISGISIFAAMPGPPPFYWSVQIPGASSREAARKKQRLRDLERAALLQTETRERARQLFGFLQNWQVELQGKRPGPSAPAAQVAAFEREHANYLGLLGEYKAMAKTIQAPTSAP